MCRRGVTHLYTCSKALAGVLWVLNTASSPASAQQPAALDASFEERFALEQRAGPVFTRPEVQQLLSSLPAAVVAQDSIAAAEAGPAEPRRSELAYTEPKGPAKVLKELLTAPVKELLVSRAEAEPDVRRRPSEAQASAPPPSPSPEQRTALIPPRHPEPLAERPPAEASVSAGAAGGEGSPRAPAPDAGVAPAETAAPSEVAQAGGTDEAPVRAGPPAAPAQRSAQATQPQDVGAAPPAPAPAPAQPSPQAIQPPDVSVAQGPKQAAPAPAGRTTAAPREPRVKPAEPQATAAVRVGRRVGSGRATWYQHPGRTASGEKFNPNGLTAAHRTLPFGARVRVVREGTGRWVDVRINDRIPRKANAFIDLSRASARAIGITGHARVSLYQL